MRGFAVTSYGSQGKTADTVLVADAGSVSATNAKQWYVSISRGRKRIVVFTSDQESLRERIQRDGSRELATDVRRHRLVYGMRMPRSTPRIRALIEQACANEFHERQRLANEQTFRRSV